MNHLPCLQLRSVEGAAKRCANRLSALITSRGIRIRQNEYPL